MSDCPGNPRRGAGHLDRAIATRGIDQDAAIDRVNALPAASTIADRDATSLSR